MVAAQKRYPDVSAQLFEYDQRFKKYGSKFTFYDYNSPLDVPRDHHKAFQLVVADPPYLVRRPLSHRSILTWFCFRQSGLNLRFRLSCKFEAPLTFSTFLFVFSATL